MTHRNATSQSGTTQPSLNQRMASEKVEYQAISVFPTSESSQAGWISTLLEAIGEGVLIIDDHGVMRYANRQMETLFGWKREELIGQVVDILLPPTSTVKHKAFRDNYFRNPVQRPMGSGRELSGLRKDGSVFPIEVSLSPLSHDSGTLVLCQVTEISKRVEAAADLHKSLQRFESLFKAFPLSTYIWQHQEGHFFLVDYNNADQPAINQAVRRFIGRGLHNIYPKGSQMVADIERCYHEKITFLREYTGYRVPYTNQIKDLNITFVYCEPDLIMVIYDDMTILNRTSVELKKLSNAVEQTADAVFITDRDGTIEYVNLGFEQMTGFTRAQTVGNTPRILKSGQMPKEYYQSLWRTVLDGHAFRSQTVNRRRSGEVFIAEQTITPMRDPQGEITHFVSVLKDMTDRIRWQEMETEHSLAGKVQKQLFPIKTPQIPGYDIAGAVFPARYTSGDHFDFISMPDNRLGIVVADVCDHGMGSALIVVKTHSHLHSILHYESDPRTILDELNQQMHADQLDNRYITVFLAILDPAQHRLEYANAGNTPTFILDRDGNVLHELRTDGYPVGLFADLELRQNTPILLPPGSITVFLTDGIHEAFDENDSQFGFQYLLEVIQRHREAPAGEIIERVREAVQELTGSGELADDQTIVICKRTNDQDPETHQPD